MVLLAKEVVPRAIVTEAIGRDLYLGHKEMSAMSILPPSFPACQWSEWNDPSLSKVRRVSGGSKKRKGRKIREKEVVEEEEQAEEEEEEDPAPGLLDDQEKERKDEDEEESEEEEEQDVEEEEEEKEHVMSSEDKEQDEADSFLQRMFKKFPKVFKDELEEGDSLTGIPGMSMKIVLIPGNHCQG